MSEIQGNVSQHEYSDEQDEKFCQNNIRGE